MRLIVIAETAKSHPGRETLSFARQEDGTSNTPSTDCVGCFGKRKFSDVANPVDEHIRGNLLAR